MIVISGIWIWKAKDDTIVKVTSKTKPEIKFVSNYTNKNSFIQLSDSSIVELFPNSTISYPELFEKINEK